MKTRTKGALTLLIMVILAGALALAFTACGGDDGNGGGSFVAVTDIKLPGMQVELGSTVTLNGIVEPADASNKTIAWAMKTNNGASVTLNNNMLIIVETSIGSSWGDITLTATISDGSAEGVPFTKDIKLWICNYNHQTNKLYLTKHGGTWGDENDGGTWQNLSSTDDLSVIHILGETVKKNTSYKITISGDLNTALTDVKVTMEANGSHKFGDDVELGDLNIGNINKQITYTTYDDEFPANFADNAKLGIISDTDPVSDQDQGKVGAIISSFNLTIVEDTE